MHVFVRNNKITKTRWWSMMNTRIEMWERDWKRKCIETDRCPYRNICFISSFLFYFIFTDRTVKEREAEQQIQEHFKLVAWFWLQHWNNIVVNLMLCICAQQFTYFYVHRHHAIHRITSSRRSGCGVQIKKSTLNQLQAHQR